VNRRPRGGPGQFDARIARAEQLLAAGGSATAPLTALVTVLGHQRRRASAREVAAAVERMVTGAAERVLASRFPQLATDESHPAVDAELALAIRQTGAGLPAALRASGDELLSISSDARAELISIWLDDPSLVAAPAGFWFQVAAGPLLELAAAAVGPPLSGAWHGSSCPLCGAPAQASVIAEESGEFMGGSPRSLVCARCASWWSFPRAICALCGQDDPRSITGFLVPTDRVVRVDCCETCHGYVKTFDLRQAGGVDIVPLVDDIATLHLDLWAQDRGFNRASLSFAGA
jgi:Protein involved in formate dehydrogenase formation